MKAPKQNLHDVIDYLRLDLLHYFRMNENLKCAKHILLLIQKGVSFLTSVKGILSLLRSSGSGRWVTPPCERD